tara:strand:- start:12292 stop:13767 length:1476 start_codon:yes stop_codon:yes gene_type:complete
MEFFDQKEEVIHIELTELGRKRLSVGRLKPAFYAFYDDDIIYDGEYGPGNDVQKDIEHRIIKKTPRVKPNTIFNSVDDSIRKIEANNLYGTVSLTELIGTFVNNKTIEDRYPLIPDKKTEYLLPMPIGTSDAGNQNAPSWELNFLKSELSSSQPFTLDGNAASCDLVFDVVENSLRSAIQLAGQKFRLTDMTGFSIQFGFNTLLDPTSGTCTSTDHTTAAGKLICLDVNGDDSKSTTALQVAQQVANKINNSALAITATVPFNDGVVRLKQDIIGDKGNTKIEIDDSVYSSELGPMIIPKLIAELGNANTEGFTRGLDSTFAPLQIPQLNVDVVYDTSIAQITDTTFNGQGFNTETNQFADEIVFEDGTYIKIDKDYILLDIKENNVPNSKNNFDIEVYEIKESYGRVVPTYPSLTDADDMTKLRFASNEKNYIYQDEKLYYPQEKRYLELNSEYVEYYFDIRVDREIQDPVDLNIKPPALPFNLQELCED